MGKWPARLILLFQRRLQTWPHGSFLYRRSPYVDTLAQLVAAVLAHLLATISLAHRQHPDFLHFKAQLRGYVPKDKVYADASALIPNIIIDHDTRRASLAHA